MAAMLHDLLHSSLAQWYRLEAIPTYRTDDRLGRLVVFVTGLGRLLRWCLRPGRRIVHVHTAVRGSWYRKAIVVALVKVLRRPVILHLHVGKRDIDEFHARLGPVRRRAFRGLFRSADEVVSVSSSGAREIKRHFGRDGIRVIPNAAPAVRWPDPAEVAQPDRDRPRVLYLGGFHDPAKGGDVLLESLEEALAGFPELRVNLAGPGDLPARGQELVARHPQVRWLGWVSAEPKRVLLAEADLFVLPSVSEGLPVALLEAMGFGKAIVATDMGGVPDVLRDGAEAELVPPGDAPSLAKAIIALARDPDRRESYGAAARTRVAEFDEMAISRRLDHLYRELLAR